MTIEYTDVTSGPGGTRTVETVSVGRRVAWGALFAGAVAALAVQLLLTMLGMAIGLSVADAALTDQDAPRGLGIAAGLWWLATMAAALFVGGCVAARLSGPGRNADGMLHGFLTWSLTALIGTFAVTSSLGSMVGGAASIAGDTVSATGAAVPQDGGTRGQLVRGGERGSDRSTQEFWRNVERDVDRITSGADASASDPDQAYSDIIDAARRTFEPGQQWADLEARGELIDMLSHHGQVNRTEASRMVDRWEQAWPDGDGGARRVTDMKMGPTDRQRAFQIADTAAGYVAGATWFSFLSLLLGVVAAVLGGWAGTRRSQYNIPRNV